MTITDFYYLPHYYIILEYFANMHVQTMMTQPAKCVMYSRDSCHDCNPMKTHLLSKFEFHESILLSLCLELTKQVSK